MSQKQLIMAIGNGGCKIVKSSALELDKVYIDTDPEVVEKYNGTRIGAKTCGKYSTQGDVELGRSAVLESAKEIEKIINEYEKVYIITSFSGGTSGGSTEEIAKICISNNKEVTVFAGMPFDFEMRRRTLMANDSFKEISKICEVKTVQYVQDRNYKGTIGNLFESQNHLVLALLEKYLNEEN